MNQYSTSYKKLTGNRGSGFICLAFLVIFLPACKKLVEIPEPINTITTKETYSAQATADAAIAGIYDKIALGGVLITGASINFGMSADELKPNGGQSGNPVYNNNLLPTSSEPQNIWSSFYEYIYRSNDAIEGLESYAPESAPWKAQFIGEAKFIRAFFHFHLVNIFGDVPIVTTSAWKETAILPRSPVADVYKQIISDLVDAENSLPEDYSAASGERIRANKWAAAALLARVYLYNSKWPEAEATSSAVISNSSLFSLQTDLNGAFLKNNPEAIFQLQSVDLYSHATFQGQQFIPDFESVPSYYLRQELLDDFEPGDLRLQFWTGNITVDGNLYYYPYKYKVKITTEDNVTEYDTQLRLSEQYLIRAEARAEQDNTEGAIEDINVVRARAGLDPLSSALIKSQVLDAIAHERRIELFTEDCLRWFDLKRTGTADAILAPIKPLWKPTAKLYPLPLNELQLNPNLQQNPGY